MTETAQIHGSQLHLGEFIYVINRYGRFLRKITWLNTYYFEWNSGYGSINELELNTDQKSNVKFLLKEE